MDPKKAERLLKDLLEDPEIMKRFTDGPRALFERLDYLSSDDGSSIEELNSLRYFTSLRVELAGPPLLSQNTNSCGSGACATDTSSCGSGACATDTSSCGSGACATDTSSCGSGACATDTSSCGSGACATDTSSCGSGACATDTSSCGSGACGTDAGVVRPAPTDPRDPRIIRPGEPELRVSFNTQIEFGVKFPRIERNPE